MDIGMSNDLGSHLNFEKLIKLKILTHECLICEVRYHTNLNNYNSNSTGLF